MSPVAIDDFEIHMRAQRQHEGSWEKWVSLHRRADQADHSGEIVGTS